MPHPLLKKTIRLQCATIMAKEIAIQGHMRVSKREQGSKQSAVHEQVYVTWKRAWPLMTKALES